jgi:hypothetical protein
MDKNTVRLFFLVVIIVVISAIIGGSISSTFFPKKIKTQFPPKTISPVPSFIAKPSEKLIIEPTKEASVTPSISVSKSPTPKVTLNIDNFIFSQSDKNVIKENQLTSLTPWQLKVARNEIYARHGRSFVHQDLACYFKLQSWYKIDSKFVDTNLNPIEKQNVQIILNYENKINSPLINKDSGCSTNL